MYEQSYKSIIAKAQKMMEEKKSSGMSLTEAGGIIQRPRSKTKKKDDKESWEDIAAQYVLFFHEMADNTIRELHTATKKESK
jgi:hypothetical protein